MKRTEIVVLFLILAIAAGFRVYALKSVPPGLAPEEAVSGNEATRAWESGHLQVFYPDNGGHEGLFVNLQAVSVHYFGHHAWALRLVSVIAGILTILGTYLLTRRMFDNWELAAMAAFLMATGFWHVLFSRTGFREILMPLLAVWGLYYLWTALKTNRLWHWFLAGFWLGLGFHTATAFRVMPIVVVLILGAYLWSLRTNFGHDKYAHTRRQLWGGIALMVGVMILVFLPVAGHLHTELGTGPSSVRGSAFNVVRTIGMFVFKGDMNWQHGISGQVALLWPVAAFFAIGLIRSFLKIGRMLRTHGHPSLVHILLVSWLFIGLVPAAMAGHSVPNALTSLLVAPAVYILAAEGLWWLYVWLVHWYHQRDTHQVCVPGPHGHHYCTGEGTLVVTMTLLSALLAITVMDASRYFFEWGRDPHVSDAFAQRYVQVADKLNNLPPATLKYVVASRGDGSINGIPLSAQTIMFLTDTATSEKQAARNTFYLNPDQFKRHQYRPGALVIQLDP